MKTYLAPIVFAGSVAALRLVTVTPTKDESLAQVNNEPQAQLDTIVTLLKDIISKTKADAEEDAILTHKNEVQCAAEIADTSTNLDHEKDALNAAQGAVYSAQGLIAAAQSGINAATKSSAATSEELKKVTAQREEETTVFKQEETELLASLDELRQAMGVLTAAHNKNSMLSTSAEKSMMKVVTAVEAVNNAIGINIDDHGKLKALLQSTTEDDDDFDLSLMSDAPQAKMVAYESKSGQIIDILEDLQEKAEGELRSLRDSETAAAHNAAMMEQTLGQKVKAFDEAAEREKMNLSGAQNDLGVAQKQVAQATANIDQLTPYLEQTKGFCQNVRPHFLQNEKAREISINALNTAVGILTDRDFGKEVDGSTAAYESFIQTPDSSVARAAQMLKDAAREIGSVGLEQIASKVSVGQTGGFDKVTKMIEDMIDRLQTQATEEATHASYCKAEIAKTEKKLDIKTRSQEKTTARHDRTTSSIEEGLIQIKHSQQAAARASEDLQNLNEACNERRSHFDQFKSDTEAVMAKLDMAVQVVSAAYPETASLVQQTPEYETTFVGQNYEQKSYFEGATSPAAMLETIRGDFGSELAQRTAENAEDKKACQEQDTLLSVEIAQQKATASATEESVMHAKKTEQDLSSDLGMLQQELDAINKAAELLHNDCTAKVETFEERNAKREAEIKSLKSALEILNE